MTSNKYWISDIINNSEKTELKSIYDGKRLNEIILPGTDNSCSISFINKIDNDEHKFFPLGFTTFINYNKLYKKKWHITQTDTITTLLEKGIRYFHFRISYFDNEWFISNKYRHIKLNDMLKEFKTFLTLVTDNNKSEFVYLDFELDPNNYFTKDINDSSPTTEQIKKFYEILKNDETLNAHIYIPQSAEIDNATSWHNNWGIDEKQEILYNRTLDGTETAYDHLLRREALVDKQLDGYTRGVLKLPTLDKVYGKAVIFVDKVLYKFENGTTDEKVNYNLIKPFPSFLLKNNSLDRQLVIDETPNQIHKANQQWLDHTKNKTNLIPIKYDSKNYKFIDSMFNKLQLSHSISDRLYETNSQKDCKELNKNNWYDRQICKRQSCATRTSIIMIYLKAIVKKLLWIIPILLILSFFNPVGGPYWGLYITIYEHDPRFYITIIALVFFVLVIFDKRIISYVSKYFVECIPTLYLEEENNENIASNLIGKFDELHTKSPWNIRQTSIISVNYPTNDIITKIINLNQKQISLQNIFNDDINNKNKYIYIIETIDDSTTDNLKPDTLKIKLWNVGTTNLDGSISYIGKLRFYILTLSKIDAAPTNFTKFLIDQDNLIINENNIEKEIIDDEVIYTYTYTINLHRLVDGPFQIKLWIEDEYGEELGTKTITNKWTNGVKQSQSLEITTNQDGGNQKWTEPFKNITQISSNSSNSSQRLKQFYESRLF